MLVVWWDRLFFCDSRTALRVESELGVREVADKPSGKVDEGCSSGCRVGV